MEDLIKTFGENKEKKPDQDTSQQKSTEKQDLRFSNLEILKNAIKQSFGTFEGKKPVEIPPTPKIENIFPPSEKEGSIPTKEQHIFQPISGKEEIPLSEIFAKSTKTTSSTTPSPSSPLPETPKVTTSFTSPSTLSKESQPISNLRDIQTDEETEATNLYLNLHHEMAAFLDALKTHQPYKLRKLEPYIPQIVSSVKKNEYLFLKAIQRKRYATWLVSHSVNIAIFAVKIGITLNYDSEKLQKLALAAFLHDVGMLSVPNSIIFKHGQLTSEEFEIVKKHPLHGYELLKPFKSEYPFLPEVALQEHEREDGSGYPNGLSGDKIIDFAKIIGILDVFEALVHGRAYREGFVTYFAIQKIIQQRAKQFNPKYVRALVNSVTMYPIGSLVKLSTEEIARVVSVNNLRPMRPVVEILTDSSGVKLTTPIRVNLEEEPLIYIVKPIEEEQI